MGLLNDCGKLIPNLSTIIYTLNALLRQGILRKWMQECAEAYRQAKQSLTSESALAHYIPQLPFDELLMPHVME